MVGAIMYWLIWSVLQVFRLFWRWDVRGLENLPKRGQGMILAVNHIHWLDILILGGTIPFSHRLSWIAKSELLHNPVARWFFNQMQVIAIRRGKRDLQALDAAEQALRDGAVLVLYAEGHRSKTGELQQGRGGAIRLAVRTGCPIVPVALEGTQVGLGGAMRRKPIRVHIGEPYHPENEGINIPMNHMAKLTDDMMLRLAHMLPEQYWGAYREQMQQERSISNTTS